MNFLSHAFLAGETSALIVGGVAGDWIKGHLPGALPADLAQGAALHRAIDTYSETNDAFRRSRTRVSSGRRRYAGVLVDMFYDHLMARHWSSLHHQPLDEYSERVYGLIRERLHELPTDSHMAMDYMAREDWLGSYARIEGIAAVLVRMSRRARQPNPLSNGEEEFLADTQGYENDFHEWLADIRVFTRRWREDRAIPGAD